MHFNRVTSIYLVIFLVFAAGIWVILEIGSADLTAPPDLNGVWHQVPPVSPPAESASITSFTIAQSGKYLRLAIDGGPSGGTRLDLVLANSFDPNHPALTFTGQGWQVATQGVLPSDSLNFRFNPPSSKTAPPSGTYQRQRMGQPTQTPLQSPSRSVLPSPNAGH